MARPQTKANWHEPGQGAQDTDWSALRNDLKDLLAQVEDRQFAEAAERRNSQQSREMRADAEDRHVAALRSVQRAVARFSEPQDAPREFAPPPVENELSTAIREIRARTQQPDTRERPSRPAERMVEPDHYADGRDLHEDYEVSRHREYRMAQETSAAAAALAQAQAQLSVDRDAHRQTSDDLRKLTEAVTGITDRLARLETDVKKTRESSGDVAEISAQVGQLTQVVEMLAGAVGESGHVKKLEKQIANLATMMAEGHKPEMNALSRRIDELGSTVERLAEFQVQQFGREAREANSRVEEQTRAISAQGEAMLAIEAGVRNVYDRIDALEKAYAITPQDFERLTTELTGMSEALRAGGDKDALNEILIRLDSLSQRIRQMEASGSEDVADLKQDVAALRSAVREAVEPRFAAIEEQIEALSTQFGSAASAPAPSFDELETQIRHLAQRMDQTGQQLTGLTELYSADSGREPAPDFEALAAMVAKRTSEEIGRLKGEPAGLSDEGLQEIESRLSRLFSASVSQPAPDLLDNVFDGISKVDERLNRLETALEALANRPAAPAQTSAPAAATPAPAPAVSTPVAAAPAAKPSSSAPSSSEMHPVSSALEQSFADEAEVDEDADDANDGYWKAFDRQSKPAEHTPPAGEAKAEPSASPPAQDAAVAPKLSPKVRIPSQTDQMPRDPNADAPLIDSELNELIAPVEDWSTLDSPVRETVPQKPRRSPDSPVFDANTVERPTRPRSSLMDEPSGFEAEADVAPAQATADERDNDDDYGEPTAADRNTFIAAARRAAQQRQSGKTSDPDSQSLIGRAFARFQNRDSEDAADVPTAPEVQPEAFAPEQPDEPAEERPTGRRSVLAGLRRKKDDTAAAPVHDPEMDGEPQRSFLSRHRQTILLAAAVVAASLLTLNLVAQRLDRPADPAPAPALGPSAPAGESQGDIIAPDPDPASLVDPTPTGAVDPFIKMELARPSPTRQILPPTLSPQTELEQPVDSTVTNSVPPAQADAAEPVQTQSEVPPEELGPLALRVAAVNGDPKAQFEVGAIYTEGRAIEQDYAAAARWYERSAAQGFSPAQYRLGNLYEHGNGVEIDLEQARLWYTRAAEAGNRMAMHNLASLYAGGALGEQQFPAAAEWFARAADNGLTDSQFNLGMLYARGLGVPQDLAASYKWFSLAAAQGDADAGKARDDIARQLDPDQLQIAQAEIAAWQMTPINIGANFAPIGTWSDDFDPGQTITERDVTERVQAALNRLGYDAGTADGVMGPKTTEAIKAFEQATGMAPLGLINPRLLAVLGSQPI